MGSFDNKPKCSCIKCKKEFYVGMLNQHKISCDKKVEAEKERFKNLILNDDYVICPICNKKLLEINSDHLRTHNISKDDYDKQYPSFPRLSKKGKEGKNHFKGGVSEELSLKLKKSHTIEGYIEKYGEEEGKERYYLSKKRKSYSHTDEYYYERYGDEALSIKENHIKSKTITLENLIKKYGEEEGTKKYIKKVEKGRFARTLKGYQNRYGKEDGYLLWKERNDNHSRKISKTKHLEYYNKIDEYYFLIEKFSRLSYNYFIEEIDPFKQRSRQFHLDHRVSRCYGFVNKIHPVIIASKYNLEIKLASENCSKQEKIDLDPSILIEKVLNDEFYIKILKESDFDFNT